MSNALKMPNENTLAQALYLREHFDMYFDPKDFDVPLKYEANSWNEFKKQNFISALEEAKKWFAFQPVSSRPALLFSYISSVVFQDNEKAIDVLNQAIRSSPDDVMILNNKVFSLLQMNKLDEAEKILHKLTKLDIDNDKIATVIATEGLFHIKKNNIAFGSELYEKAFNIFKRLNNILGQARVLYFYALALKSIDVNKSQKIQEESMGISQKYNINEIKYLIEKLHTDT